MTGQAGTAHFPITAFDQATAVAYVGGIRRFADYFHRSPEQLGPEQIRLRRPPVITS
jgi:hypothetical protein